MDSFCSVIIRLDQPVKVSFHETVRSHFDFESQLFRAIEGDHSWLGFYDWLRLNSGEVIGVRLRIDDEKIIELVQPFVSEYLNLENNIASMRFTLNGDPTQEISDDADFGGNEIYKGDNGGLAIMFFEPTFRHL
jgi:hypothetical protein